MRSREYQMYGHKPYLLYLRLTSHPENHEVSIDPPVSRIIADSRPGAVCRQHGLHGLALRVSSACGTVGQQIDRQTLGGLLGPLSAPYTYPSSLRVVEPFGPLPKLFKVISVSLSFHH
ncbi:unnamed protein product [Pieris macdunnoughi]|uniref:Uncharacterized protein n=1 Tax=Pieris macdunnoughi TaxID=345717 RepID=A0A821NUW7_9NEOP|nr:unnamed protein product [Pieris macdunnoughi]